MNLCVTSHIFNIPLCALITQRVSDAKDQAHPNPRNVDGTGGGKIWNVTFLKKMGP